MRSWQAEPACMIADAARIWILSLSTLESHTRPRGRSPAEPCAHDQHTTQSHPAHSSATATCVRLPRVGTSAIIVKLGLREAPPLPGSILEAGDRHVQALTIQMETMPLAMQRDCLAQTRSPCLLQSWQAAKGPQDDPDSDGAVKVELKDEEQCFRSSCRQCASRCI